MKILRIQRFSTLDGPGIRTVVFLKECPLRCLWCHNPESQTSRFQIFYAPQQCMMCRMCAAVCVSGAHQFCEMHTFLRERCIGCGKCTQICPSKALEAAGTDLSVEDVFQTVKKDTAFYGTTGGLTLSGGEPTAQWKDSAALLRLAREAQIHTAIETCGVFENEIVRELAELCDIVLFDLKDSDAERFKSCTGGDLEVVLQNLYALDALGVQTILRCICIHGINDDAAHAVRVAQIYSSLSHCIGTEILPHHPAGKAKYAQLGMMYRDLDAYNPDEEQVRTFEDQVRGFGVPVFPA